MKSRCPECNKPALPREEQPEPGTHAGSIKYSCGSQIVVVFGESDYWEWETPCPLSKPIPEEISDDN